MPCHRTNGNPARVNEKASILDNSDLETQAVLEEPTLEKRQTPQEDAISTQTINTALDDIMEGMKKVLVVSTALLKPMNANMNSTGVPTQITVIEKSKRAQISVTEKQEVTEK